MFQREGALEVGIQHAVGEDSVATWERLASGPADRPPETVDDGAVEAGPIFPQPGQQLRRAPLRVVAHSVRRNGKLAEKAC